MFPTALIYSSHNRCEDIHRWWIVERALKSVDNKTILYVPMSMGEMHQQEYSWGTFRWYFDRFRKWGLEPRNFYWRESLSKSDVDTFFDWLINSEVVILGGGNSILGMQRYKDLGARYYGREHLFGEMVRQRQRKGLLTAGFSAGADQLCSMMAGSIEYGDAEGFGLGHNLMTTLHHEHGRENDIRELAQAFPNFMVFGLPNDSALALDQGFLPSGNIWQMIECVIDKTWDLPHDAWHIKTRSGLNVEHYYSDGRNWSFQNGDKIVRIISPNNRDYDAWVLSARGGPIFNYWRQEPTGYESLDAILASH